MSGPDWGERTSSVMRTYRQKQNNLPRDWAVGGCCVDVGRSRELKKEKRIPLDSGRNSGITSCASLSCDAALSSDDASCETSYDHASSVHLIHRGCRRYRKTSQGHRCKTKRHDRDRIQSLGHPIAPDSVPKQAGLEADKRAIF